MLFTLVLYMSYYRGGVSMVEVQYKYPSLEVCQAAGRVVVKQDSDIRYVCVPSSGIKEFD